MASAPELAARGASNHTSRQRPEQAWAEFFATIDLHRGHMSSEVSSDSYLVMGSSQVSFAAFGVSANYVPLRAQLGGGGEYICAVACKPEGFTPPR